MQEIIIMGGRGIKGFLKDKRAQMVGTPLKIVIAVVIGVAVLGILLQMMNLVNVMNPHSFSIVEQRGFAKDGSIRENEDEIFLIIKDETDGTLVEGAIVELRGAGANLAAVTNTRGEATLEDPDFDISGARFAKTTITVTKEGYSRWTKTYLVKP